MHTQTASGYKYRKIKLDEIRRGDILARPCGMEPTMMWMNAGKLRMQIKQ
jgi:hypothetical protein